MYKVFYETDGFGEWIALRESRKVFFGIHTVWDILVSLPIGRNTEASLVGVNKDTLITLLWDEYYRENIGQAEVTKKEKEFNDWVNSLDTK